MDRNDDLTICARVKDWEIFTPDWDYVREFPVFQLRSLCALSVGLNPIFADYDWIFNVAIPHFNQSDIDETIDSQMIDAQEYSSRSQLLDLCIKRIHIASANLSPRGALPIADGIANAEMTEVRIDDFAAWALQRGWSLPENFPRSPSSPRIISTTPATNTNNRKQKFSQEFEKLLGEIETRAKTNNKSFNRYSMPGTKANLWELSKKFKWPYSGYKESSFKTNIKNAAICTFPRSARSSTFYKDLFPELFEPHR